MYQFEATDDPSSNHFDQITQPHTPDGRGILEDTDLIFVRALRINQIFLLHLILLGRHQFLFKSHSDKFLRIFTNFLDWMQFGTLHPAYFDGLGGTTKQHYETDLLLFFLTVLGIFLSFPNRLWESDKRVLRTNNCSRKRMNNSI